MLKDQEQQHTRENTLKNTRANTFLHKMYSPQFIQRSIQYSFLLFYAYIGFLFYAYAQWAMGLSAEYVAKPPAAEAFLPISALLGAKRLFMTGQYDPIHPAGLTILLLAVATALLFRKGFCGYLCPVGTISMFLGRLGKTLGISRTLGKRAEILFSVPKYLLLIFFVQIVLVGMSLSDIDAFIRTPYNMVADTKMLFFFLSPTVTLLVILFVLALGGMLFPGFWCRGFCPYGALLGLISWGTPLAIQRNTETCTGCRRCTRACPQRIFVHEKARVSTPECLGCTACIAACPEADCLHVGFGYTQKAKKLPFWVLPAGTLLVLYFFFLGASVTGNWQSKISPEMIRMYHKNVEEMIHP